MFFLILGNLLAKSFICCLNLCLLVLYCSVQNIYPLFIIFVCLLAPFIDNPKHILLLRNNLLLTLHFLLQLLGLLIHLLFDFLNLLKMLLLYNNNLVRGRFLMNTCFNVAVPSMDYTIMRFTLFKELFLYVFKFNGKKLDLLFCQTIILYALSFLHFQLMFFLLQTPIQILNFALKPCNKIFILLQELPLLPLLVSFLKLELQLLDVSGCLLHQNRILDILLFPDGFFMQEKLFFFLYQFLLFNQFVLKSFDFLLMLIALLLVHIFNGLYCFYLLVSTREYLRISDLVLLLHFIQ